MSVRARAAERLSIVRRPRLHAPFELAAPLLSVAACASLVAEAEAVAARQGGWGPNPNPNPNPQPQAQPEPEPEPEPQS